MTACLMCCCLAATPAADGPAAAKPLVLLAGTDEYKAAKGAEGVYEGVVENNPADSTVGKPTRFNAYRMKGKDAAGQEFVRELYVPGKAFLLAPLVGKRVRVTGKFADTAADGKVYAELWPAQVEEATVLAAAPAEGVYGRCFWQPDEARRFGPRVFVYRSDRELARGLRLVGGDGVEATANALMAQKLGEPAVDWKKRMVVTVAAGLRGDVERLTVTRAEVKDGAMTVFYRLPGKPGAGGFGYPAETILVDRCDGAVRAELEPAAP